MFWLDIVLGLLILWSLVSGFRQGMLIQLCGIAGILVGIFLASRFGESVGLMIGARDDTAKVTGFAIILIAAIITLSILAYAMRGILKFAGLGAIDSLGGAVLGAAKTVLILGLLVMSYDTLNKSYGWTDSRSLERSRLYAPLKEVVGHVTPYFNTLKEKL